MALENFTLGLEEEHYWPEGRGYMEAWCGWMPNGQLMAVFVRSRPEQWDKKFLVSVRKDVQRDAEGRMAHFNTDVSSVIYRQDTNELDVLAMKCIALEGIPTEVTA